MQFSDCTNTQINSKFKLLELLESDNDDYFPGPFYLESIDR